MFLRDLNVLFWPPGINHQHASLPGRSPATTAWAAFLHPAAGKAGTKQDQIWFGGLFPVTCLHTCTQTIPDASWSLGPKITGINTAHTNFWTNTFIQKFYSTDTVQKHPHRHQTQGSNPTKCKAQSYRRSHMKRSHFVGWQSCASLWYSASALGIESRENPYNSWIV